MVIKVQALDVQTSSSANIKYGLVVENINKKFFNRGRINPVFDVDLLDELIIANETILKYTMGAVVGSENVTMKGEDGTPVEITHNYIFLSEHVLGIQYVDNKETKGSA